MTRRLNWILLTLLLLFGPIYYWLLLDNRPGDAAPKPVTIVQLRELAASLPGQAPAEVRVELVGWRRLPGTLFAAGIGLKRRLIGIMAFELPVAGGKPIMIDSGLTQVQASEMGLEAFRADYQARVDQALAGAGLILITHEHPDHIGGLAHLPGAGGDRVARLNTPQRQTIGTMRGQGNVARPANDPDKPYAAAPGVVVIPAPSHTPGSQIVFVRLATGREYLFAGDIATLDLSWREVRARSRLVGDYIAPENRAEVFAWLRTIRALKRQAPSLVVVPGHDFDAIIDPLADSRVIRGFTSSPGATP